MAILVKQLSHREQPALIEHFLSLPPEDIYLRFGHVMNVAGRIDYVEKMDFEHDVVFGVYGDVLQLVGVAHLARSDNAAEFGISVLRGSRGPGVGTALLARAITHARNLGLNNLFVHFVAENATIRHLAQKQGLACVTSGPDSKATVQLPAPNAGTVWGEWLDDCVALYDYNLKAQVQLLRVPTRKIPSIVTADMA